MCQTMTKGGAVSSTMELWRSQKQKVTVRVVKSHSEANRSSDKQEMYAQQEMRQLTRQLMLAEVGAATYVTLRDKIIATATQKRNQWKDIYHDLYCIGSQFANAKMDSRPEISMPITDPECPESDQPLPVLNAGLLAETFGDSVQPGQPGEQLLTNTSMLSKS